MSLATTCTDTTDDRAPGTMAELVDRFGETEPTLLAVWAHPDDESYLGAGLMAEVARRGGRVVSVCATPGEHGTEDPSLHPPSELAARREQELGEALQVLGAEQAIVLGYGDGTCDQVPKAIGAHHVGSIIDRLQPDLVLGFGPDGVTGHPDHRAVARWTELAIAERGHPMPFFTTAAGAAWPRACIERMDQIGAFWPGYPDRLSPGLYVEVQLEGALLDRKMAALACHESQIGPLQRVLGTDDYRRLAAVEAYRGANRAAAGLLDVGSIAAAA